METKAPAEETVQQPSLTAKAVRGTVWSAISTGGKQLLTIASVATVARKLGPGAYGVMGMAGLLLLLVSMLRDLGTGVAIIQKSTLSKRLLSSLFWVNVLTGMVAASIVAISAPFMARFFHQPLLMPILTVLSISFVLTATGVVHNSLLYREMQYQKLAIADLSAAALTYLVALSFAYSGFGVWSLVFANLTSALSATLFYWLACRWRPSLILDRKEVESVLGFSLNLTGFVFFNFFSRNADNIIVGKFRGDAELGNYSMAYNLMLAPMSNITAVIAQVTFPAFARIQDDISRFRSAYMRQLMLIGLITFPLMAGMGVLADPLIRAVLKDKWAGAIPIFQILAPVGLVQSIWTMIGTICNARGRTDLMFRMGLGTSVVLVIAFLIGVRYGAVGVAAAYAITFLGVITYPTFAMGLRLIELRFRDLALSLLPQLLITLAMALTCLAWLWILTMGGITNPWVKLLTTSPIGAIAYIAMIIGFRPAVLDVLEEIASGYENRHVTKLFAGMRRLSWRRS